MELMMPKNEHNRMLDHARSLLKKREEAKWEICKIALRLCYIPEKKGGRYDDKYSITNFAEDIGMNRKTLSCWILDYQAVYRHLNVNDAFLNYTERRKLGSHITRTRKELFNFNKISRESIDSVPKEVVEETFFKYAQRDLLTQRLEDFVKNISHHRYTFMNENFNASHKKIIDRYRDILGDITIILKELEK